MLSLTFPKNVINLCWELMELWVKMWKITHSRNVNRSFKKCPGRISCHNWIHKQIKPLLPCALTNIHWKCHQNLSRTFWFILLTISQTLAKHNSLVLDNDSIKCIVTHWQQQWGIKKCISGTLLFVLYRIKQPSFLIQRLQSKIWQSQAKTYS